MVVPIAIVQTDAGADPASNVARAAALADEAAGGGAMLVALPEYLQLRGPDDGFRASARPIPGEFTEPFADVARRRGCWILAGSLDLQFPELYRTLALAGADVLAVPSNFMERTGRDHWEVLLRARAIENGCWVIAPSQTPGRRLMVARVIGTE